MDNKYPTIGEYNQAIQKSGGNIFDTLKPISLIPSRTSPIKVYLFGSGAYAAVFKGFRNGQNYALRCFLNAEGETFYRYQIICNHLAAISSSWKTSCEFLNNEVEVKGNRFPVLKMDWVDGVLINEFVTKNLNNNKVLAELQKKLIEISNDLESNQIGHGDLQGGNIIITGSFDNFQVRLIDYDGMYVPGLKDQKSLEKGRSEFQHPKRTVNDFNPQMDRFSFWVMITALEALKFDKTLWKEVMQGGYNTLDNFLFTSKDFVIPEQSKLFNSLYQIGQDSLNFYIDKLKSFSLGGINDIAKPYLKKEFTHPPLLEKKISLNEGGSLNNRLETSKDFFQIKCSNCEAVILNNFFQQIGVTPLQLEKSLYSGKTIIATNGKESKRIALNSRADTIVIAFEDSVENFYERPENNNSVKDAKFNKEKEATISADSISFNKIKKELEEEKQDLQQQKALLEKEKIQMKENRRRRKRFSLTFSYILISVSVFGAFYLNYSSFFEKDISVVSPRVENYSPNTIRALLKAEEKRNFQDIKSFFSPSIKKYWNLDYPSSFDLKASYEKAWNYTSDTKNDIWKIIKIDEYNYELYTTFSYTNPKTNKRYETKSVVKYIFDSNGKISKTYGVHKEGYSSDPILQEEKKNYEVHKEGYFSDPILQEDKKTSEYKGDFLTETEKLQIIRAFLLAEEKRNFEQIFSYFSLSISRFYDLHNPTRAMLKEKYEQIWQFTAQPKNEILEITKVEKNTYDLTTLYSYYDLDKEQTFYNKFIIRFILAYDGKITKTYGLGSESINSFPETNSENQISSSSNSSENQNYYGYYKFQTTLQYPNGRNIIRVEPNVNSEQVYSCPGNAKIYVLDNNGRFYFKVHVNGHTGFISKVLLKRNY